MCFVFQYCECVMETASHPPPRKRLTKSNTNESLESDEGRQQVPARTSSNPSNVSDTKAAPPPPPPQQQQQQPPRRKSSLSSTASEILALGELMEMEKFEGEEASEEAQKEGKGKGKKSSEKSEERAAKEAEEGDRNKRDIEGGSVSDEPRDLYSPPLPPATGAVPSYLDLRSWMLPRGGREDFARTAATERHNLQHTIQSLVATVQQEQQRRVAAEERAATLESSVVVHQELAQKHKEEAERHRRGHTQVLRDLNRFKASAGFHQMPDDFLTQRALELRQDIRDFAIQYFLGELPESARPPSADSKLAKYMQGLSSLDPAATFLRSPTRCAGAIEAFLWVVLAKAVFGGWYWAGNGRMILYNACRWLRTNDSFTVLDAPAAADPEAERRFCAWRASTAKLVSEKTDIRVRDNLRLKLVDEICETIEPYLRVDTGTGTGTGTDTGTDASPHRDDLVAIINKAVAFDKDTSQQASRLEWVFCRPPAHTDPGPPTRFDPRHMDLQRWETLPEGGPSEVLLVMAPGLRKRGKSNGEDYAAETTLLKMEVSCEPVTDVA